MWPVCYRILAAIVPIIPRRLRFRFWNYLHTRGRRLWEPEGLAQCIEGGMYIKQSRPSEGETVAFVRSRTRIPVPVVIDNVTVDGVTVLVLSALPGDTLLEVGRNMTADQSRKLSKQISAFLAELRALPPPYEGISGFGFGETPSPVRCERVAMFSTPYGPWPSVTNFHSRLVERAALNVPPELSDIVLAQIRTAHSRKHRVCLTHNDLAPQNILVDAEFNITGIIDWEAAGWLPEYWSVFSSLCKPFREITYLSSLGNT